MLFGCEADQFGQLVLQWHSLVGEAFAVVGEPEVDCAEPVGVQAAEVVFDRGPQLLGPLRAQPAALLVAGGADLGDQHEVVGVGVQRFTPAPERTVSEPQPRRR